MQKLKATIKKASSTRKGRIWLGVILLVIIGAVGGGILYWQYNKKFLIRNKLEDTIDTKTDGLYSIRYGKMELDEVNGNLRVENLTLKYDSIRYVSMLNENNAPPVLLKIKIPSIVVTGVKTPRALMNKEIVGKKLQINRPTIEIFYTHAGKDSMRNAPTKEVYKQILGDLNLLEIDTVEINQANIITRNLKTGRQQVSLLSATIGLVGVKVDSASWADSTRLLFGRELGLRCSKITWSSANKMYDFAVDSVTLNSVDKTIFAGRIHMDPVLGEDAFVKSLPTQDDRFDFKFNQLNINNVDFPALLNEELIADNIVIGNSSLHVYRDLSIPRDKKNRVGTYPHQLFAKLPVTIRVKKMVLSNCFIEYKEKNPRSNQAGKVQFHQTYAVITNLDNRKGIKNNIMTADISSRFLNKAPLKVTWSMYLNNPNGRFDIKGKLGSMDAKEVNAISEPMGPARLEDGQIQSFEFNLSGGNNNLSGEEIFLYDDLKVALLERDAGEKELDKKGLTSFIANIVIKNSNPSGKKDKPRVAKVSFARDTNRSIFYLIWKTMFQGIQETVGIKKKK